MRNFHPLRRPAATSDGAGSGGSMAVTRVASVLTLATAGA